MSVNPSIQKYNYIITTMISPLPLLLFPCLAAASPRVVTRQGEVAGRQLTSRDPRSGASLAYAAFTSIPFARPPVGSLRFAAPQRLEAGEAVDTSNVTEHRMCYQLGDAGGLLPGLIDADEDCLYLNVFVPGVWPPPQPLPVMIWFTGGAFIMGGSRI